MSRPWMPLYVADYLADTGHLTGAEHGAYLLLIMHYWQKGSLPDDDQRLASIARASLEQWQSMRAVIAEFFGEGWTHHRIDAELKNASEAYERRASAGRKGGKAKADQHCSSNATAMLKQSQSQPHIDTEPSGSDAASPVDVRSQLWSEGLSILIAISGKQQSGSRQLLGKWLKGCRDDCAFLMSKIIAARDNRVGDPVSWITAAISASERAPPRPGIVGDAMKIIESERNGSESVFGNNGNAQFLSAAGSNGRRIADENLPSSIGRRFSGGHH